MIQTLLPTYIQAKATYDNHKTKNCKPVKGSLQWKYSNPLLP